MTGCRCCSDVCLKVVHIDAFYSKRERRQKQPVVSFSDTGLCVSPVQSHPQDGSIFLYVKTWVGRSNQNTNK